jgi:preprotein translocase subunit SecA
VSLEDDLIKIFAGEKVEKWVQFLMQDTETPLESELLTNTLENAQKKVESFYSDSRKNIFQYDEILNTQRKQIFEARKEFFYKNFFHELIVHGGESFLDQKWEEKENQKFKTLEEKN